MAHNVNTKAIDRKMATFLGWKEQTDPKERWVGDWFTPGDGRRKKLPAFDTDWNYLMMIVDKIESLDHRVIIGGDWGGSIEPVTVRLPGIYLNRRDLEHEYPELPEFPTRIELTYLLCSEFIDWRLINNL